MGQTPDGGLRSGKGGGGGGKLGDQDSNLDKQNQNLLCYRYTIAQ